MDEVGPGLKESSPASKRVRIDKNAVELCCNHRAFHTLEILTGKPYRKAISEYCEGESVSRIYPILYSLCSTWIWKNKEHWRWQPGEKDQGYVVPGSFLDALPVDKGWDSLKNGLYELLLQAGLIVENKKKYDEYGTEIEEEKPVKEEEDGDATDPFVS